jgi:serine/threonine-protein kinase RsbW
MISPYWRYNIMVMFDIPMDNESINKVLRVYNQIDELNKIAEFLEEIGEELELSSSLVFSLNLVLEEALTNIISYGFDDKGQHIIEINLKKTGSKLLIIIIDDGHEYDPTVKTDPDITLAAEDRPVGGLGIFLIKKIMDKVEYQRKENKNHLILTKIIEK